MRWEGQADATRRRSRFEPGRLIDGPAAEYQRTLAAIRARAETKDAEAEQRARETWKTLSADERANLKAEAARELAAYRLRMPAGAWTKAIGRWCLRRLVEMERRRVK